MASIALDDIADDVPSVPTSARQTGRSFRVDQILDDVVEPASVSVDRGRPSPAWDEMGQPTVPEPPAQVSETAQPQDEKSIAGTVGRQFARGAIETAALAPKAAAGLGARLEYNEQDIAGLTEKYAAADRPARAAMRRGVLAQFRDSPGTRDSLLSRFSDIDEGTAVPSPQPVVPVEQRRTYQAGQALEEFGRTQFPTTPEEDASLLLGQIPRALGSTFAMAPVAALGAPAGALGRLLAGVGISTLGSGEAVQTAADRRRRLEEMVRSGDAPLPETFPSDRQMASAAGQGLVPGALDAAAIDNLLRPVVRAPGFRGLIAAVAKKAVEQGIVEGTTEGIQQVMQNLIGRFGYDPSQEVLDQVAENVLVGGAVGVLTGGLAGGVMRPPRVAESPPLQVIPPQENTPSVSRETPAAPETTSPELPQPAEAAQPAVESVSPVQPGPAPGTPEDLAAVLADPRSVGEIMAERQAQAARTATAQAVEREAGPEAAAAVGKALDGAGRRETPMQVETAADVAMAAAQAERPTPAQAEAGNYRHGHLTIQGLDIAIETPQGGTRTGIGSDGLPWSNENFPAHYGYLKRGQDTGDGKVDVFVGDEPSAPLVYVIDQIDPRSGKFDEPKAMLGFEDEALARATYEMSFHDGSGAARLGAVTPMSVPEFKVWLRSGDPTKALAYEPSAPVAAPAATQPAPPSPAASPSIPPPGTPAAPPSTTPTSGPLSTAVAAPDPLAVARAYAGEMKVTPTEAEWAAVRDLIAEGTDPEAAVEMALTSSVLDVADETADTVAEAPFHEAREIDAGGAERAGEVARAEVARAEPADTGAAPEGEARGLQPVGAEQGGRETAGVEQVASLPAVSTGIKGLSLRVGGLDYPVSTIAEASQVFIAARDRFGEGGSKTPTPLLLRDGIPFGYVSYNGRVWAGDPMSREPGEMLYSPFGGPVDPGVARIEGPHAKQAEAKRINTERAITRSAAARKALETRRAKAGPLNIVQTIARAGGMKDAGGDLRTIMGRPNLMVPLYGALRNERSGIDPDRMREMLVEAKFLPDGASLTELYAAIDQTVRGKPVYSAADASAVAEREAAKKAERQRGRYGDEPSYQAPKSEKVAVAKGSISDEQMVIPGAERVAAAGKKEAKAPQRSVAETPLFGGEQSATKEVKSADLAREKSRQGSLLQRDRLRVAGEIEASARLTPQDRERRKAVIDAISVIARRMAGAASPRIEAFDAMEVGEQEILGAYSPLEHLLAVSLRSPDKIGTARHELIHVLRQLGLIDSEAWSALEQAAETDGWLAKHEIDTRWGDGLSREQAIEEAIAEEFGVGYRDGVWKTGNAKVDAIFQRIAEFMRRVRAEIKRALSRVGMRDMSDADVAEYVFSLIERGAFRERASTETRGDGVLAQTAWHGTPHDFEKFSTEKIGTGEGAQAYGYGLYFAGSKDVAEYYRNTLAKANWTLDGKPLNKGHEIVSRENSRLALALMDIKDVDPKDVKGTVTKEVASLRSHATFARKVYGDAMADMYVAKADMLEAHADRIGATRGRLYEVNLSPEEDQYLLWDRPLSEQSEKVKAALLNAFSADWIGNMKSQTGSDLYWRMTTGSGDDAQAASRDLRDAGIRGIKYLDGGSRSLGDGSYNYVIFDDADVSITAKYQMAKKAADAAARLTPAQRNSYLRSAISALRGGDLQDPKAKVRPVKDIGWWKKTINTPRHVAAYFEPFADVFFAGQRQFQARDRMIADLSTRAKAYLDLPQASKEKVNKVLEHGRMARKNYAPMKDGTITVKNDVGQQKEGRIGGVTLMKDGETVTLTPDEAKAYVAYRDVMNKALDNFRSQVVREWGFDPADPTSPKTAAEVEQLAMASESRSERNSLKSLAEILSTIQQAQKRCYVPFTRYGSHYVVVTTLENGKNVVIHREHIEPTLTASPGVGRRARFEQKIAQVRARLAEMYPASKGFQVSEVREVTPAAFDEVPDFADLEAIISAANLPDDQAKAVQDALSEVLKKRGFRKHFIKSRDVPGYSTDFERSLADYIVGVSGYLARREAKPEIDQAISSIPPQQGELRRYAKEWNKYIQNPSEEFQGLRNLGFMWFLAGRPSSAIVNLTQTIMGTLPYLRQFTNAPASVAALERARFDTMKAIRPYSKARGGAGMDIFLPDALPADVRDVVKAAIADGTLLPIETFQEMARARGKTPAARTVAAKAQSFQDAAALMFTAAERMNRLVSFIAAYRLAQRPEVMAKALTVLANNPLWTRRNKDRGVNPETFARFVTDETQFVMGKINRAPFMTGAGSLVFQFRGFMLNYLEMLSRMGFLHDGASRFAALGLMMTIAMGFGGMFGLPGGDDTVALLEAIVKFFTDVDPMIEDRIRRTGGSALAAVASFFGASEETAAQIGAAGGRAVARGPLRDVIGVDIGQRVGPGKVAPQPTGTPQDDFWYRAVGLAGIPGSYVLNGLNAIGALGRGDVLHAGIAMLPQAAADIARATQLAKEGVRTAAKGQLVLRSDEKTPDGSEVGGVGNVIKRGLGFQPTGIARAREQIRTMQRVGVAAQQVIADFNRSRAREQAAWNKADARGDEPAKRNAAARIEALRQKILAYNEAADPANRYDFTSPGYRRELQREMGGQTRQIQKHLPRRVRGSVEDLRSRY